MDEYPVICRCVNHPVGDVAFWHCQLNTSSLPGLPLVTRLCAVVFGMVLQLRNWILLIGCSNSFEAPREGSGIVGTTAHIRFISCSPDTRIIINEIEGLRGCQHLQCVSPLASPFSRNSTPISVLASFVSDV